MSDFALRRCSTLLALREGDGWMGTNYAEKKRYEDVRFNVIRITRGWVGGDELRGKKRYEDVRFNVTSITRFEFRGKKSVTKMYGSMLLALRGSGFWSGLGSNIPKKVSRNT